MPQHTKYLPQRNENTPVDINMHRKSIHDYQKLKTIQTDFYRRMNVYDGLPSELKDVRFSSV